MNLKTRFIDVFAGILDLVYDILVFSHFNYKIIVVNGRRFNKATNEV